MKMNERMKKVLSALLCLCMLVQNCPVMAFAAATDNLCDHHIEHTADCGYREGSAGSACTHKHSEDCYKIVACKHTHDDTCSSGCSHSCTVENGCITMDLDCHHTHGDCGYAEAVEPQDCTTCQPVLTHAENCGYVAPVAEVTCACVPGEDGTLVHTEGCGYVAPVAEVKCACEPTVTHGGEGCTYAEGKAGSPCTHTHAVKVDSADSCYKLLCSHKDGGHDGACGYVAAVEAHECHYECAECAAAPASEEPSEESSEPAPVCDCGTDDALIHATTCGVYVAPENPVCYCAEKCNEVNEWCDVCGFDYTACGGTDTAVPFAGCTCDTKCTEDSVNSGCEVCTAGISSCNGEDVSDTTTVTIYFDNTLGWKTVNAYYWSESNFNMTAWPGVAMTNLEGNIWSYAVPSDAAYVIFNNGGTDQTDDLTIPTDGKDCFKATDKTEALYTGFWYDYPCTHSWTDGECTLCGATCAHESYENGTCTLCGNVCTEHTGGTATCTEKAVCEICGASYGETADHSMGYSVDQDALAITYRCATCDTQTVTFTLVIPTDAVYGSALEVPHYQCSDTTYSGEYPVITLDGKALAAFVSAAGTYNVVMAWGGQTVSGEYTIAKADPVYTVPTDLAATYGQTLADVTLPTAENGTWSWISEKVDSALVGNPGSHTHKAAFTPNDTANYNTVEVEITITVAKATPTVTAPTANTLTYNGQAQTLINAGNTTAGTMQYKVDDGEWSTELPKATAAGEHTVYYKAVGNDNYNDVAETSFTVTIAKATLTASDFTYTAPTDLVYNGTKKEASVTTSLVGVGTVTVKYYKDGGEVASPTDAGTYTVKIDVAESDNYNAVTELEVGNFEIAKADPEYTVPTGLTVYVGQKLNDIDLPDGWEWHPDNDPDVYVFANYDAGYCQAAAIYTPDDKDNYETVERNLGFTVLLLPIDGATVTVSGTHTYNGSAITPEVTVTLGEKTLTKDTDYTVSYSDNVNAGTATVTITGKGDYTGKVPATFTIEKATPAVTTEPAAVSGLEYTGAAQTLVTAGTASGGTLQYKVDNGEWSTELPKATNAGTYTVSYKVVGNENYNDVAETSFTVTIGKATPTVTAPNAKTLTYNGQAQALVTAVSTTGGEMQYSIAEDGTYGGEVPTGTNAGTYTVWYKVVGGNNYNDVAAASITVTIEPKKLTELTFVGLNEVYAHTGSAVEPEFTVKDGNTTLTVNTDYTVEFTDNTNVGTATITITLTGNYSGTVTKTFEIKTHVHDWSYALNDAGDTITATCKGTIGTCPDAEQSVTISAVGKTYDGTPVTATLTGSIDGVDMPEITYCCEGGCKDAKTHTASITIEGVTAEAKFTIVKATVTVTADAKSKTYGTENPELTYTASGLFGNDTLSGALATTATKTSDVGEYDITVGTLANSNYTISFAGAKLSITKATAPAIQWPTASGMTYGQKLSDSTLTGEDENGTFAWQDGSIVPAVTNNGYVVVYTPKDTDNYDYTGVELTKTISVTVSKAEPNIIWKSGYYNTYGTNMYITADINGVDGEMIPGTAVATVYGANGNALNSVTCTKTDSTGTYFFNWLNRLNDGTYLTPGEYLVKLTYQGSDNYGEKTVELVTYTINKRALTVTANDNTIIYDDKPAANGVEYSGFVDGETEAVLGGKLTYSYNYEQYGNVGTYTITPSGLTSGNYEITFKTGELTVNAKEITVTADAVSKTYGDADPELTYKVEGLVNGDKLSGALTREVGTDIGTYAITQGTLTAGSNYTINYTGANLTINKKAITKADVTLNGTLTYNGSEQTQPITVTEGITYTVTGDKATNVGTYELTVKGTGNYTGEVKLSWSIKVAAATVGTAPTAKVLVYTGNAQNLINAGSANGGTMQYSIDNQTWSTTIPQSTDAGEYTVWYYVKGDDNHSDTAKASVKVTIAKADPVIGTVGCDMNLFDSTAASAVELTRTNTTVDGTLVLTDSELTAGEGTYNWKFTPKDTNNYNTITGTVVLNVTADVLEKIEASGTLEKDSYSYGDTFSIDGLTVTATYTTGATKDVTELVSFDSTLAVGQTSVELTYQGKSCTVTGITVAKKQIVISGIGWEVPENPTYRGTVYTAVLKGTLPEGVTVTKTGDTGIDAGDYTAKAVFSLADGYSADNYVIVNGEDLITEWSIGKKDIAEAEVVLGDTLTYNGKEQTQAVTKVEIDGLTVTYTVSGNTGTDAKGYTLTITGNGNFEGTATAEWSIAKKNISGASITLDGSLTYNGNEQTMEVTEVKIDGLAVTYNVTDNKQTNAGNYTLAVTGNGNFEGTATAGWSIGKAKLTITAMDNTITYGDAPAAAGLTYSGFVSNEGEAVLGGTVAYSYSYEQYGNVGTYKITPAGLISGNYEITFADGILTVAAKTITVKAENKAKTYGEADPALTYTVEGLVNGDELTGELKRAVGENVGSYAIEQNTLTAGNNYTITYTGANLTINAKAITKADVKLNGSLTYNGKEQTQAITVNAGITYEVIGNKAINAGEYELTVKGIGNNTGSVNVKWSIAKAAVTITADNKVIYVGAGLPTLTYTVSGLMAGDELTKVPTLTTNANAAIAGSYVITAANADAGDNYAISYVSGILTVMDAETEVKTKVEKTALTEVPDGLKGTEFNTVEAITEELISRILATSTGYTEEDMVHYDVSLQFSLDGGETWILATEENFPTGGITVTLPYPEGTNAAAYDFVVSHMFTVTSQRLGTRAGDVELPSVEETADGIRVTLKGLSPVSLAWKTTEFDVKVASASNGTVKTNLSKATTGTEVTITVTPKSGYKMATLTVKDSSGKSYAVSTDNNGKYYFTMPSANVTVTATFSKISTATADPTNPKTGDDFYLVVWSSIMSASSICLLVAFVEQKRKWSK